MNEEIKHKGIILFGIISGFIALFSSIWQIISSYLISSKYIGDTLDEFFSALYENTSLTISNYLFSMFFGFYLIPIIFALFIFIKNKVDEKHKKIMLIPLISQLLGSIITITMYSIQLFIFFKIAPDYIAADEADKAILFENYSTLAITTNILSIFVYLFVYGITTIFFGFIANKLNLMKNSVYWSSFIIAFCSLFRFGVLIEYTIGAIFLLIAQVGAVLYLYWLGNVSFTLLIKIREKKNKIPDELLE